MGEGVPKQFRLLAGRPVLVYTLEAFLHHEAIEQVILTLPREHMQYGRQLLGDWLPAYEVRRVEMITGGATRTASVWRGLSSARGYSRQPGKQTAVVAIHDAVRPFVTQQMISSSLQSAYEHGSGISCVPVKSSLREQVDETGTSHAVDRSRFFHVQTPQSFRLGRIWSCYENLQDTSYTDDASLYEACGHKVVLTEGSYDNIKITTPEDFLMAEQIMAARRR
jgi:2-C-methyl-D-erythritol 4-phosphate cytidylyltransferase